MPACQGERKCLPYVFGVFFSRVEGSAVGSFHCSPESSRIVHHASSRSGQILQSPSSAPLPLRGVIGMPAQRFFAPALWIAFAILLGLRLVALGADCPSGVGGTDSMALWVDEGYKTLAARNLVTEGRERWHPDDLYAGWADQSPLMHWAWVVAFRASGVEPTSARRVTVGLFALLLLLFLAATRDLDPPLRLAGLVLLGTLHPLYFYSRMALLELPLTVAITTLLLALRYLARQSTGERRTTRSVMLVLVFSVLASFGIKRYASLYFLPILVGVLLPWALHSWRTRPLRLILGLSIFLVPASWAFLHRDLLESRMALPYFDEALRNFLLNPLTRSAGLMVACGLFCAFHTLTARPRTMLEHPYRSSLILLVILGPVLFLPFPYDPLRYYLPLLPAFLLLALEWLHLRAWSWRLPRRAPAIHALLTVPLLAWSLIAFAQGLDKLILVDWGWRREHSLERGFLFPWVGLPALALCWTLWHWRHRLFQGRRPLLWVSGLLLLSAVVDGIRIGAFLAHPSYHSRQLTHRIAEAIPAGTSVAGDWAPFLTLGPDGSGRIARSLYLATDQNEPACLPLLRNEYFLYSDTTEGNRALDIIRHQLPGVELGRPRIEDEYAGRQVVLYPLIYENPEPPRWPDCPLARPDGLGNLGTTANPETARRGLARSARAPNPSPRRDRDPQGSVIPLLFLRPGLAEAKRMIPGAWDARGCWSANRATRDRQHSIGR